MHWHHFYGQKKSRRLSTRAVIGGRFVSDSAGVLGPEYISLIDAVCRDLQAKTTVELALVTVNDLGGTTIDDFAEKLFRRFGIGAAGKDNGLLLLFLPQRPRRARRSRLRPGKCHSRRQSQPDTRPIRRSLFSQRPDRPGAVFGRS